MAFIITTNPANKARSAVVIEITQHLVPRKTIEAKTTAELESALAAHVEDLKAQGLAGFHASVMPARDQRKPRGFDASRKLQAQHFGAEG